MTLPGRCSPQTNEKRKKQNTMTINTSGSKETTRTCSPNKTQTVHARDETQGRKSRGCLPTSPGVRRQGMEMPTTSAGWQPVVGDDMAEDGDNSANTGPDVRDDRCIGYRCCGNSMVCLGIAIVLVASSQGTDASAMPLSEPLPTSLPDGASPRLPPLSRAPSPSATYIFLATEPAAYQPVSPPPSLPPAVNGWPPHAPPAPPAPSSPPCVDVKAHCVQANGHSKCATPLMREQCRHTCGLCLLPPPSSPPPTPPPWIAPDPQPPWMAPPPPPHPLQIHALPHPAVAAGAVRDELNRRFYGGRVSPRTVAEAGVLVHCLDGNLNDTHPWLDAQGWGFCSASLLTRLRIGRQGLFNGRAALILSPSSRWSCGYPQDSGTRSWHAPKVVVGGCGPAFCASMSAGGTARQGEATAIHTANKTNGSVTTSFTTAQATGFPIPNTITRSHGYPCAFAPALFTTLFDIYLGSEESYAEMIVSTDAFAIEAVVGLRRRDWRMHQRILDRFGLNARQLPLLEWGPALHEYNKCATWDARHCPLLTDPS